MKALHFFVSAQPRTNEPDEMSDTVASSTEASEPPVLEELGGNIPSTKMPGRQQPPPNCTFQVGGFNPFEKYDVKMGSSSPNRGENNKYLKPPPSFTENPLRDPGSPKLRIVMKLMK